MGKYAAFFRNLNLGRANCPDKARFEAAFMAAGAQSAASFLTNGTLVFSASTDASAHKVLLHARQTLHFSCGLREPAFMRRLDYLAELVALDPFAQVPRDTVYECCVSFLSPELVGLAGPPPASARQDVEILHFTDSEALSISRVVGRSPGSPNAVLEKLFGLPATTRSRSTVARLVQKHVAQATHRSFGAG
ncbi:MAG TPA: DUF1697 domain-containing protein [Burkholderiaceae bacterium]|nr:DUF1697 domain-containing protein [Burkholderiaceae bacterium]